MLHKYKQLWTTNNKQTTNCRWLAALYWCRTCILYWHHDSWLLTPDSWLLTPDTEQTNPCNILGMSRTNQGTDRSQYGKICFWLAGNLSWDLLNEEVCAYSENNQEVKILMNILHMLHLFILYISWLLFQRIFCCPQSQLASSFHCSLPYPGHAKHHAR